MHKMFYYIIENQSALLLVHTLHIYTHVHLCIFINIPTISSSSSKHHTYSVISHTGNTQTIVPAS